MPLQHITSQPVIRRSHSGIQYLCAGPGFISISPHTNNKVRHSDSLGFPLPLLIYETFLLWVLDFMMQLI